MLIPAKANARYQSGFSLIEAMLAMVILMGTLLSLAAVFTEGMVFMSVSQMDTLAKQKATEAIEGVFSARDTRVLTWARIRNVSDGGIFLNGPQALHGSCPNNTPANDDITNTADDVDCPLDKIIDPGPDGLLSTSDDLFMPLSSFTREVEITDTAPNLRRVRVIVRYRSARLTREYILTTFFSSFA